MVADQTLTVGGLIACVILSTRALAPIAQIAGLINKYYHASLALRSLNKVMAIPSERQEGKRFLSRPVLKGGFKLRGVSFAYPNMTFPSLLNVNLNIKQGERVGVIGKIGSGKSTLVKLMMNFYDISDGHIKIDDTDIRQIDPADIRANIAYVSQDPGLFRGTIRENITLAKPQATDAEILRASKLAGVLDFLQTHPDGFDAMVGDNGEGFSGGQKQAIAMARAFLVNPNIMICDEPTNAMDVQSETHVIAALKQQTAGKTFILVTHKPNMLELVDRVLVMQDGQLVADGPRDQVVELMKKGVQKTQQELQEQGGQDEEK
jgi:ATP-binding cassette subfamily C protein LapB